MKNFIAEQVLKRFFKGYLIEVSFRYNQSTDVTITIDLGRFVSGDVEALDFETSPVVDRQWLN